MVTFVCVFSAGLNAAMILGCSRRNRRGHISRQDLVGTHADSLLHAQSARVMRSFPSSII